MNLVKFNCNFYNNTMNMSMNDKSWNVVLPNISKMMSRRDLTFHHKINEFSLLFYDNDKNIPYILICIFIEKVGVDNLKKHLKQSCNNTVKNYIIVYENHMTSTCNKIIHDLFQYDIELFSYHEFFYDITQLYYYIPHKKVEDADHILELKKIYGNKFPIINISDPICKYFNFKKDDILKITRSETEIAYRIVK